MKALPKLKRCMGEDCPGCSMCDGGKMAKGGEVKGVHEGTMEGDGKSMAGIYVENKLPEMSKREHREVLMDMKADKGDRKFMAEGGEAEMDDMDSDDELNDACAEELMHALESKDKKGVLEAIRAIVLNMGDK